MSQNQKQLEPFFNYKSQLMKDLLTNESIVKLIDDELPFEHALSLEYSQVFPYEYVPETAVHGYTYICCEVDIQKALNKTYLLPTLYIWVFAHKSKLRLPQGGLRVDNLCSEIAEAINGSRFYGLGELDLYSVKRYAPMTDYQGKVMTFTATDYNHLHDPNKAMPSNRRVGA